MVRGRILVAEHDHPLRDTVCLHLSLEGYSCEGVADGESAIQWTATREIDLVVVDVATIRGGVASLAQARRARRGYRYLPILMLCAPSRKTDALLALEQGADDYLVKPFSLLELVARVRALMRRSGSHFSAATRSTTPPQPGSLVRRHLVIDPARRSVNADGRPVKLTEQEFRLLYVLAEREGVVFDRGALLARVWGNRTFVTVRSVDALVKRVRRSLMTAHRDAQYVVTVRGVGYKFEAPASIHG